MLPYVIPYPPITNMVQQFVYILALKGSILKKIRFLTFCSIFSYFYLLCLFVFVYLFIFVHFVVLCVRLYEFYQAIK